MLTNKYIWINRDVEKWGMSDRRMAILCRLGELLVESGELMNMNEKEPASIKYMAEFIGADKAGFYHIRNDLLQNNIMTYDAQKKTYSINPKYIFLPHSKNQSVRNYVRISCYNYDKLFPVGCDTRYYFKIGHLVRLALHIGVGDNSVRLDINNFDENTFCHLSIDEVLSNMTKHRAKAIQSELEQLSFKSGQPCIYSYPNKIVVNPLLFATKGVVIRKRETNKPFVSEGEEKVEIFLKEHNIDYERNKTFDGLLGIGNKKLSYDFYIQQYNVLLECQGSQHYKFTKEYGEKEFLKQREHDHRKWEYAKNNKYVFLEIPYWHYQDVDSYLSELLSNISYESEVKSK